MSIVLKSGASTDVATVDVTSKALRVTQYDSSGNLILAADRGAVAAAAGGELLSGTDYKIARPVRALPDGTG